MKVVFLLDNPFLNDRRVMREARTLVEEGHQVILFAVKKKDCPAAEIIHGIEVRRIFPEDLYSFRKYRGLLDLADVIVEERPDVVHCHDHLMLGIGARTKKKFPPCTLIYDSHELFQSWPVNLTGKGGPVLFVKSKIVRTIQVFRERRNARHIDHLITVNQSIASHLSKYFRLKNPPVVVRNLPELAAVREYGPDLRKVFDLPGTTRILVFIGAHVYRRTLNLEQVIGEFGNRPDTAFIIICGDDAGKEDIREFVEKYRFHNIFFHPLLPPSRIESTLGTCDVGLVPTWNRKNLSYWYALDNKLFEYMMAGIPVLATRQPEYTAIVEKYGFGECVDPDKKNAYFEGFQTIIRNKGNYGAALEKAGKQLNWEHESKILASLYREINNFRN